MLVTSLHTVHIRGHARRGTTFWTLQELDDLIKSAHAGAKKAWEEKKDGHHGPIMGHDINVGHLWTIRDIWQYLQPGHHESPSRAAGSGAFVHFGNLSPYHDFMLKVVP